MPDEIPLPRFEDRLSEELARLHRERQAGGADVVTVTGTGTPGGPCRPRHWRPLAAGFVALAMAGGALAVDATWGSDDDDRTAGPTTTSPGVRLSDAEVVARVRAATAAIPDDAIVHETRTITESPDFADVGVDAESELRIVEDPESGVPVVEDPESGVPVEEDPGTGQVLGHSETWTDPITAASRMRITDREGEVVAESGWPEPPAVDEPPAPGLPSGETPAVGECDPASGLAVDEQGVLHSCEPAQPAPPQPTHAVRMVDHCHQTYADTTGPLVAHPGFGYIELFLDLGNLVVDGTEEVDGRELLRVRNEDGTSELLVDPETYMPVRMTLAGDTTDYAYLPRTAENLALVSPAVPDGFAEVPAAEIAARVPAYWSNPSCD